MQFIKVRDVKSPIRDVNENAGIDFYIPENTEDFIRAFEAKNVTFSIVKKTSLDDVTPANVSMLNELSLSGYFIEADGSIHIPPHSDVLIPSGIKSKFEPNIALIANNKSGIATKKKLIFGASVIDSSYQGEWHLHVINTSDTWQVVECGTKLIQFIPHLISMDPVEVVDMTEEEFYSDTTSKRGSGGFGSTGLN